MTILKYSTVVLLLLAQETLAGGGGGSNVLATSASKNEMCALYCETYLEALWAYDTAKSVYVCTTAGPTCAVKRCTCSESWPAWTNYASMNTYQMTCSDGSTAGLCSRSSATSSTWDLVTCPVGDKATALCIRDSQRRRKLRGESKKKGEPVYQEGSQMEVEIDGVKMVIWDAKEQE
jgi:hypothetical protein